MPLSCSCDDDGDWWHEPPDDYSTLDTKRCRKCASCRGRIPVGALVLKVRCWRYFRGDAEIAMPNRYLCERCGDLWLSLTELGFCLNLGEDMRELVRDYAEIQRKRRAPTATPDIQAKP